VFFTASEEKFGCQPCRELRQLIGSISKAFKQGLSESQKKSVFFVEIDYKPNTAQIFQGLQMQQVPQVVLIDLSKKTLTLDNFFDTLGSDGKFTFDQQFNPQALVQWIATKSGVEAPETGGQYQGDGGGGGGGQIGGGPVSGAGFLVSLLIVGVPVFYVQRRNPVVYFVIATMAFFFCISGGMFNIIRQVPFAEVDRNGKTSYFSGGGQFQYASEGYIMGGLQIAGGIFMVLMNTIGVKASDGYRRHVLTIAFAVALYLLFAKIRELYMIKMPGYNHGFVWNWMRVFD
jgi:oligosaccharyltransferase complex subunit gamma